MARTDHSHIIKALLEQALTLDDPGNTWVLTERERHHKAQDLRAAAALLEVHDATGLNLHTFGPVLPWVERMIAPWGHVTDNGC